LEHLVKIALIHSFYSGRQPSGENDFVLALQQSLADKGHQVRLVGRHTDELETSKFYGVKAAVSTATGIGPSPIEELRTFSPDVVHVHNLFPNWGTKWLKEWAGPIVSTIHNFRPMCAAGTFFRDGRVCLDCIEKNSFQGLKNACYRGSRLATLPLSIRNRGGLTADPVLTASTKVLFPSLQAMELYEANGLSAGKTVFMPGTVTDKGFRPKDPLGKHWVFAGRLSEEKGVLNLLKYWPDDQTLYIFGDGPLRAQVKMAQRKNIFFGGQLSKTEIPLALSQARGLIFSSEWFEGGTPLVYIEALAAGRPVIALTGNSVARDVSEKGTGMVFHSWEGLHAALKAEVTILEDISRHNRNMFDEHYSSDAFARAHLAVYESLLR
jgi:glycosyltransferase involved in cell wall biosynthesis